MSVRNILASISQEIDDIFSYGFNINVSSTTSVPSFDDPVLTFESGKQKQAKEVTTCVLFIDIRNSTQLNLKYDAKELAKLYTAFTKGMIIAADFHGGKIRNIIGDRIMVVFPQAACFTSAVDCAITMNMVSAQINNAFKGAKFECGIGIDYGKMLVLKTGLYRRGDERNTNRNLVWLGEPANIASKLTDMANKTVDKHKVSIVRSVFNFWHDYKPRFIRGTLASALAANTSQSQFVDRSESYDPLGFIKLLEWNKTKSALETRASVLKEFNFETQSVKTPSILITQPVYDGFKLHNPTRNDITDRLWKRQDLTVPNYKNNILGSSLTWKI
ncbi:adenylate/guanylate cyclase domain-containing protein [Fibrella forsythiae]|uniref:Adenylate/guanylate cyclase domain-containing protein n=1 Tax=Fibrella forsythiae TaxID=2817061 RepID=A0ABS3JBA3_9BACT|nr:adenylate/guanylate cyclase domain-containing protein [Fibrella forsythiae]MBO0947270.1 adenylate/guanylate cyclase domain-containing protein [Fibrella forsythiae]